MQWCAVIGDPIKHSLSPVIHSAAYRNIGIDMEYRRLCVGVDDIKQLFDNLDGCRGLSITMPLKDLVAPYLDRVDGLAKVTGAINTAVPAGHSLWTGFNTDVYGIVAACREVGVEKTPRVAILGAGSTAASALAAVVQLEAEEITVVARKPRQIMQRAHTMGLDVRLRPLTDTAQVSSTADIVISTLPAGVADNLEVNFQRGAALLDASYANWPSPLVLKAHAAGAKIVPGISMLVHQACMQVSLFTSQMPKPDCMYSALTQHGVTWKLPD